VKRVFSGRNLGALLIVIGVVTALSAFILDPAKKGILGSVGGHHAMVFNELVELGVLTEPEGLFEKTGRESLTYYLVGEKLIEQVFPLIAFIQWALLLQGIVVLAIGIAVFKQDADVRSP
jgi:hypothetical protein